MGAFIVESCDIESLEEFSKEEYSEVDWTNFVEESDDHCAIWGWNKNGTYTVALAILKEVQYDISKEKNWVIKFISELAGPVIQPPKEFLKTRPMISIETIKKIKKVTEWRKELNI